MEMPHRNLLLGQQQHKHHCRLCEKSFSRRKELREHMRTHAANGEHIPDQGKDPATAGEECESAGEVTHDVHTNPNCHRIEHGRCSSVEAAAGEVMHNVHSNPNCHRIEHGRCSSAEAAAGDEDDAPSTSSPSSSRSCYENRRARRNRNPNSSTPPVDSITEEEGLAHFLVMLSAHEQAAGIANRQDSSPARILRRAPPLQPPVPTLTTTIPRGMFACKTCNKVFNSHQALGGHRASHKKVKGCFAVRVEIAAPEAGNAQVENINDNIEDARIAISAENRALSIVPSAEDSSETLGRKKPKVHECSICGQQFLSGQALGGHKRCHWLTSNSSTAVAAGASVVAANAEPMIATAIAEPVTDTAIAVEVGSGGNEVTEIQPHTPTIWPMFSGSDSPPELKMPTPMNEAAEILPMEDGSAEICLRLGWDTDENRTNDKATAGSNHNVNGKRKASTESLDDEAESKEVKVPRLIDVIEMEEGQDSSTWLQIGIGSMADQESRADRT